MYFHFCQRGKIRGRRYKARKKIESQEEDRKPGK
jgi:hypothetical protein